jgi:hypothetical protein
MSALKKTIVVLLLVAGAALLGAAVAMAETRQALIVPIIGSFLLGIGLINLIRDFWKPPSG